MLTFFKNPRDFHSKTLAYCSDSRIKRKPVKRKPLHLQAMWVFAASSLTLQQSGGCRLASDNICMLNGALGMFHVFFFFTCITWFVGILVSRAGIEPTLPALEAQSLNHWTTRAF